MKREEELTGELQWAMHDAFEASKADTIAGKMIAVYEVVRAALLPTPKPEAEPWGWVVPRGGNKKPVILDSANHEEISAICEEEIHGLGYFPLYAHPKPEATLDDLAAAGAIESISFSASDKAQGTVTVHPPKPEATEGGAHEKGWQSMDTAPLDGKHCILAVREGPFIYSVQGAFQAGQWNAVHRDNVQPLCWMPNVRLPDGITSHQADSVISSRAALTAKQTDGREVE